MFSSNNKFKDIGSISKNFSFSKALSQKDLPGYFKHYCLEDEQVLVAYKTSRDHAVFTDNKVVIFDSLNKVSRKEIYTLPYKSLISVSIIFDITEAELNLYLEYGYPVTLKFINLEAEDKVRLRLLYTCISRKISNENIPKNIIDKLVNDEVNFKNDSKKTTKDPK